MFVKAFDRTVMFFAVCVIQCLRLASIITALPPFKYRPLQWLFSVDGDPHRNHGNYFFPGGEWKSWVSPLDKKTRWSYLGRRQDQPGWKFWPVWWQDYCFNVEVLGYVVRFVFSDSHLASSGDFLNIRIIHHGNPSGWWFNRHQWEIGIRPPSHRYRDCERRYGIYHWWKGTPWFSASLYHYGSAPRLLRKIGFRFATPVKDHKKWVAEYNRKHGKKRPPSESYGRGGGSTETEGSYLMCE